MTKLQQLINELDGLSTSQQRFFLGWCKEGGEEFIDVLQKVFKARYEEGFLDGKYGLNEDELE